MEKDFVVNGIHIGEHSYEIEKIEEEIYERAIKTGSDFVMLRPIRVKNIPQEYFIRWAKYLADNKIYFMFLYSVQHCAKDRESYFDPETVEEIKKIAGEYFLGDSIGEVGGSFASKHAGYFIAKEGERLDDPAKIKLDYQDMKEAHDGYLKHVGNYINISRKTGMHKIVSVEATSMHKYNTEAGVDIPLVEICCSKIPDIMLSSIRGVARAYGAQIWGTYIAQEWYGGYKHDDVLKRKRLEITYKLSYISGSNVICIESGDEVIRSFGQEYPNESELCEDYRTAIKNMNQLIKNDERPKGGPKVSVAFVSGLHDAWATNEEGGSSVWNQFGRKEWGYGEAEHSWRILNDMGQRRIWSDVANHGDMDLSGTPAYGLYDIVPIEAPAEKLKKYDYLIFVGWNSMTDENLDKLIEYVECGGKLLATAAHLNCSVKRDGEFLMPSAEKIAKLFGCRFTGEIVNTNAGVKFRDESVNPEMIYPGTKSLVCDPLYSCGYVNYAKFELCGGIDTAIVSDSFREKFDKNTPAVIENKFGKGYTTLLTSVNYPGHPAVFPLYNILVRETVTASHRASDIKVIGGEKLRYAVYEGDKIYVLNTDFDIPLIVKIIKGDKEHLITLEPSELKIIQL